MEAKNIAAGSAGRSLPLHQNDYLQWVNRAEGQLRSVFADPETWNSLRGETYWKVRELTDASPRATELINGEAAAQAAKIEALLGQVQRLADRLAASPGLLTVLDTHVLLHFEPPDQVDWIQILGAENVRIVLLLRVIEELDEKKYAARNELADRARRLLSQLLTQLAPSAGAPTEIRPHVTVEIPFYDEPRRRTLDADEEILETCIELRATGSPVVLVTDDAGLHLRAVARGLSVMPMPERYLRTKLRPS